MAGSDRRHFPRQHEQVGIQVLLIPSDGKERKNSSDQIHAKICNRSQEGLCLEIDRALRPGGSVSIKMEKPGECHPGRAYCLQDGLVVWCKEIDIETSRFGVGLKILRKVVQADVLTSRLR